jgi:hypothetical protein
MSEYTESDMSFSFGFRVGLFSQSKNIPCISLLSSVLGAVLESVSLDSFFLLCIFPAKSSKMED